MGLPREIYRLRVPYGLGQQELKLEDEIRDDPVFCQALREADRFKISTVISCSSNGDNSFVAAAQRLANFVDLPYDAGTINP
jgi:hypothetical protein